MTIYRLPIKNYPGYWATSLGKIYSEKTHKYLKPFVSIKTSNSTPIIRLQKNNKSKTFTLRRLLFRTFNPHKHIKYRFVINSLDSKRNNVKHLKALNRGDALRALYSIRKPNRGVYKRKNKWVVMFRVNNKTKTFGYYKTKKEAKKMYKKYFNKQYANTSMSKM